MRTALALLLVTLAACGAESPSNPPPAVDGATLPPVTTCPTEQSLGATMFPFTACDVWPDSPRFVTPEACGMRAGLTPAQIRIARSTHPEATRCGDLMGLVLPRDIVRRGDAGM